MALNWNAEELAAIQRSYLEAQMRAQQDEINRVNATRQHERKFYGSRFATPDTIDLVLAADGSWHVPLGLMDKVREA